MLRPSGAMGVRRPDRSVSLERPLQDASTDTRLRDLLGAESGPASVDWENIPPVDARDLPLKDLERAAELAEELGQIVTRMPPGSFTQDPGMRARDEFTDVGSAGYREAAKRVSERGGAKEYATSVEEEEAETKADTLRNRVGMVLMALATLGGAGVVGAAGTAGAAGARTAVGRLRPNILDPKVIPPWTRSPHPWGASGRGPNAVGSVPLDVVRPLPPTPGARPNILNTPPGPPPRPGWGEPGTGPIQTGRSVPLDAMRSTTAVDPVALLELQLRRLRGLG